MELTYRQEGDYLLPNLTLPEDQPTLGKYGMLRKTHLMTQRKPLFAVLVNTGQLWPHLAEIDQAASQRLAQLMPALMQAAGATEALKAQDQMKWVGLVNSCQAQAEETILTELVYS